MATNFPNSLDTFTNPTSTDKLNNPDHAEQHANANDAILALETKVGINSSTDTNSHDYKLKEISGTDKAVGENATQTLTNKTLISPVFRSSVTGWIEQTETWTYASATSFTIAGIDVTAKYQKGTKLRFRQGGGYKYAVVVSSSFTTNTTVNVAANSDYSIANAAITDNAYSYIENPAGWPSWFNYAPTGSFAGGQTFTLGNGTLTGKFMVLGKLVHFKISLTVGSTTNFNSGTGFRFSLPVAASSSDVAEGDYIGDGFLNDVGGGGRYMALATLATSTTIAIERPVVTTHIGVAPVLPSAQVDHNSPFVFGVNDKITIRGSYAME
jgi:hypothetical protein